MGRVFSRETLTRTLYMARVCADGPTGGNSRVAGSGTTCTGRGDLSGQMGGRTREPT